MDEKQHELLTEIHERTIRIDERLANVKEDTEDHEKRIRSLEKIKNWALGILGLGAAAGTGSGINNSL